ncbi:MAG: AMP-binding protein [Candidatus Thiodiazotropha sp. (ex Lucinoma borealis)]|nr:AMP-binding protein [Candidatus Thiodiazotropha sp. (ex Lucinoma borealis)]MCU7867405.1 AMP-binding protein [Candidatus Thiodiazotropha sp. (ex Lucinoma borealis)]
MDRLTVFPKIAEHDPVAYNNGCLITYKELLNDVAYLVKHLPRQQYQTNLCENRYKFLVGLLAALTLNQIVLLPPNRAKLEIENIEKQHGPSYRLIDNPQDIDGDDYYLYDQLSESCTNSQSESRISFPTHQTAIKLYTSGTTGTPISHVKTWGMLYKGALLTGKRMGLHKIHPFAALATVPPQHMYGLETSIMLPVVWNGIITSWKPFMPEDISDYAAELSYPLILATTPLHISSCVKVKLRITNVIKIVSATAPFSQTLAKQIRNLFSAEINEIFGTTETGAIATRNTAETDTWTLLPGMVIQPAHDSFLVDIPHYDIPIMLHDRLDIVDDSNFSLLGRNSDMIKIAGKRASLGDLNAKLLEIECIEDGVFYVSEEVKDVTLRMSAFIVSAESNRARIMNALRERIDPAFIPRRLHFVVEVPRNETGKINRDSLSKLFRELC